ncbi:hypothetical protein BD779DRAFT_1790818 [Infundibulicybe gibba]|nr:hypothetical protein BD779DRAFT_1790818 [Infundibulicybe gibba]
MRDPVCDAPRQSGHIQLKTINAVSLCSSLRQYSVWLTNPTSSPSHNFQPVSMHWNQLGLNMSISILQMPPRKTSSPSKSTGKRKARAVSSERNTRDPARPPKKKVASGGTSRSVPRLLPGVSLLDRLDAANSEGAVGIAPALLPPAPAAPVAKSNIVMSSPPAGNVSGDEDISDDSLPEFPDTPPTFTQPRVPNDTNTFEDAPERMNQFADNQVIASDIRSDDDSDEHVDQLEGSQTNVGCISREGSEDGGYSGVESHDEDDAVSETISDMTRPTANNGPDEPPVMDRSLQDPDLYSIYENLPPLPFLCEIKIFNNAEMTIRTSLADLRKELSGRTMDLILRGLMFNHTDCYVNLSRVAPAILTTYTAPKSSTKDLIKARLTLAARNMDNVVCITLGMVTESFVVDEFIGGGYSNKPFSLHKLTLSLMFGFRTIVSSASPLGLSFQTRRKTSYQSTPQSPESPIKSRFLMNVSSPKKLGGSRGEGSSGNVGVPSGYPTSRRFDEKSRGLVYSVPVFDGRAKTKHPFTFAKSDFSKLRLGNWPLYKGGREDLPENSLVAVGYTANTYEWPADSGEDQLSLNLQFVIFLGVPVERSAV